MKKELSRDHSKTYTVLTPATVLKNNLERQLGDVKLQQAMEIISTLRISQEDTMKLRDAWNIIKKDGEVNLLLSLIEMMKICE